MEVFTARPVQPIATAEQSHRMGTSSELLFGRRYFFLNDHGYALSFGGIAIIPPANQGA